MTIWSTCPAVLNYYRNRSLGLRYESKRADHSDFTEHFSHRGRIAEIQNSSPIKSYVPEEEDKEKIHTGELGLVDMCSVDP